MAVKASNQLTLVDLTDGYSVVLTNDNYTFLGTTNSVEGTQNTTCQIQALCGSKVVPCMVDPFTGLPEGLSIVSDSEESPTLTITATSALTKSGSVTIPVHIGEVTISKIFSYTIAFKGQNGSNGQDGTSVTITSTSVTYQTSDSGTEPPKDGDGWLKEIPESSPGQYLWTKTEVSYSDGQKTVSYSVSRNGNNGNNGSNGSDGTSVTITEQKVTYQVGDSGTEKPTGEWLETIPSVPQGKYLWTKTEVSYSDGQKTESYSVSYSGTNGSNGKDGNPGKDGEDALSMVIISSNGSIFKNTAISTTLTAHVYKGGAEVTGDSLTALGTINWYKDEESEATATGSSLTISAGDVVNHANYTAKLEG